jgi:hypothetical protein
VAHECGRHGIPCYGFPLCYWETKKLALNGGRDRLTREELEFVGVISRRRDSSGGWHQPNVSVIVDSAGMDPADRELLQALMDVEVPDRERLRFLG